MRSLSVTSCSVQSSGRDPFAGGMDGPLALFGV